MSKKDISIIIPVYKGESFIVPSLKKIDSVLRRITRNYELICVIDGNVDKSFELARELAEEYPKIKVFGYKRNRGKGYAVRYGMKKAMGKIVGFTDVGLEIDPKSLVTIIDTFYRNNADVVVGSKRHRDSVVIYPGFRKFVSFIYYYFVKFLFKVKVTDTQAGIKVFKGSVIRKIYPELKINGFAFDIEILALCERHGFTHIYEAPIYVRMIKVGKSSTINSLSRLFVTSLQMFYDTLRLFIRLQSKV